MTDVSAEVAPAKREPEDDTPTAAETNDARRNSIFEEEISRDVIGEFSLVPGTERSINADSAQNTATSQTEPFPTTGLSPIPLITPSAPITPVGSIGSPMRQTLFTTGTRSENIPLESESSASSDEVVLLSDRRRKGSFALVVFTTFLLPVSSTIMFPLLPMIAADLQTTNTLIGLGLSLYMLVLSVCPAILGSISDHYGRRPVWFASLCMMSIFAIFVDLIVGGVVIYLASAISLCFTSNIAMLICLRVLMGVGVAGTLSISSAIIADMFPSEHRGHYLIIYMIVLLCGYAIGPLIGGAIGILTWRGAFYFLAVYGFALTVCNVALLPETLSTANSKNAPRDKPWQYLLLFKDLRMVACCLSISVSNYALFSSLLVMALRLGDVYQFSSLFIGLFFLPVSAGMMLGPIIGGRLSDYFRHSRDFAAARLIPSLIASLCLIVPLVIYGVLVRLTYIAIPVCTFFIGLLTSSLTPGVTSYMMELYPKKTVAISGIIPLAQYLMATVGMVTTPIAVKGIGEWLLFIVYSGVLFLTSLGLFSVYSRHRRITLAAKQRFSVDSNAVFLSSAKVAERPSIERRVSVVESAGEVIEMQSMSCQTTFATPLEPIRLQLSPLSAIKIEV